MYRVQDEPLVRQALLEDLGGAGDVTTDSIVGEEHSGEGLIVARETGCLAGVEVAALVFELLDPRLTVALEACDGQRLEKGQTILRLSGPARPILTGERTALNLLGRMGGVASATRQAAERVAGTRARVVCTRKTTPGLRLLEKYAVRCGGGASHRFGLDDGILIKDNHVALAGGVREAVNRVRSQTGHMLKVELEVDTLEQLRQALDLPVDAVLLDNMAPAVLREAVALVDGRLTTEASGGITLENLREVAETGVDLISMGSLTHSVKVLDLSMEMAIPERARATACRTPGRASRDS